MKYQKLKAFDLAIGNGGLKIIVLMRLAPIFPINLFNYCMAVTKVSNRNFFLGTFGLVPKRAVLVYFALGLSKLPEILSGEIKLGPWQYALYGFGAVIAVILTVFLYRMTKKELAKL
jgi:uncharacterized membrane protein YdjX (TVP38/TMEM64 family)